MKYVSRLSRKKVIASKSALRRRACKPLADVSVPFCGKGVACGIKKNPLRIARTSNILYYKISALRAGILRHNASHCRMLFQPSGLTIHRLCASLLRQLRCLVTPLRFMTSHRRARMVSPLTATSSRKRLWWR